MTSVRKPTLVTDCMLEDVEMQHSGKPAVSCCLQGFQRVADNLADTALDNPRAKDEFPTIVEAAQRAGWLESDFEVRAQCSGSM
jgi:hypothetical protein